MVWECKEVQPGGLVRKQDHILRLWQSRVGLALSMITWQVRGGGPHRRDRFGHQRLKLPDNAGPATLEVCQRPASFTDGLLRREQYVLERHEEPVLYAGARGYVPRSEPDAEHRS